MTLTERIASALKEPNDEEIFQQSREISYSAVAEIQQDMGFDEDNARYSLQNVIYTLLLERKALLAQVEAERWRDAEKEKPEHDKKIILLVDGKIIEGFYWSESGQYYNENSLDAIRPTHWKPINLPTA